MSAKKWREYGVRSVPELCRLFKKDQLYENQTPIPTDDQIIRCINFHKANNLKMSPKIIFEKIEDTDKRTDDEVNRGDDGMISDAMKLGDNKYDEYQMANGLISLREYNDREVTVANLLLETKWLHKDYLDPADERYKKKPPKIMYRRRPPSRSAVAPSNDAPGTSSSSQGNADWALVKPSSSRSSSPSTSQNNANKPPRSPSTSTKKDVQGPSERRTRSRGPRDLPRPVRKTSESPAPPDAPTSSESSEPSKNPGSPPKRVRTDPNETSQNPEAPGASSSTTVDPTASDACGSSSEDSEAPVMTRRPSRRSKEPPASLGKNK